MTNNYQFYIETPITGANNVNANTIKANQCPFFKIAVEKVLRANGINPADAYPTSSAANGCSVVTCTPSTSPVRCFSKAYLLLTPAQWATVQVLNGGLTSLATNAVVMESRTVCASQYHYTLAGDSMAEHYDQSELLGLDANTSPRVCQPRS